MRFKEVFNVHSVGVVKRLSNIGSVNFDVGSTDKNTPRTPHYEIQRCLEIFETNSLVNTGISQLVGFIIPNKDLKFASKDKKTVDFLEKWHMLRKNSTEEIRNILTTNIICGNAPMEKRFTKIKNGDGTETNVLDNFFSFNNMTVVYVNMEDMYGDSAYIVQLPVGTKSFYFMGEIKTPQFYRVTYMQQYQFVFRQIYGIAIPFWKFVIYKSGWSRDNIYGRSMLASAIDDANVMENIKSSWDTISKTRQIDHKILTPDVTDPNSIDIDQDKLDELGEQLENSDKSYSLLSIPLKLISQDIDVAGKYDLMEGVYDIMRRNLQTALLPNSLTPWSDTATTQGVETAMPSFMSRLLSKQNEFISFLNHNIIDELRKTYNWLAEDATFVFDKPKILPDDYYINQMNNLVNGGMITAEQGKSYLLNIGIIDEDIFNTEKSVSNGLYNYTYGDGDEEEEPEPEKIMESVETSFNSFRTRLNRRYEKEPFSTAGWKEVIYQNIGGHEVRVINSGKGDWLLFDGLNLIEQYEQDVIDKKQIKDIFNNYVEKVKEDFEKFQDEETPEDIIINELDNEIKKEIESRLEKIFKDIKKNEVKKEGFLSSNFLKKFDGAFNGFSAKINSLVGGALGKLGVTVIDDSEDETIIGKPDKKTVDMLKDKNRLLSDSLKSQVKTTSDKMLADIKSSLSTGIVAGKDIKDIKSDVEKQFNYEDGIGWKFKRAVITGSRNASGLLRLKKYKQMGLDEFKWKTMEDSKVRPEHAARNNKVYKIDDALSGKIPYPGGSVDMKKHPNFNCRCRSIPF